MTSTTDDDERPGVIGRERARRDAQTVPEAEAEAYGFACRNAEARGAGLPDREAHRAAFYARHGFDPNDQEG